MVNCGGEYCGFHEGLYVMFAHRIEPLISKGAEETE